MKHKGIERAVGRTGVTALTLAVILLTLAHGAVAQPPEEGERYTIRLQSRSFIPEPPDAARQELVLSREEESLREAEILPPPLGPRHVIVQLAELPDRETRRQLEAEGVRLLSYLNGNAYYAVVEPGASRRLTATAGDPALSVIRWSGPIEPADRVAPEVLAGRFGDWAVNPDGTVKIRVTFFEDVTPEGQEELLRRYGDRFGRYSPHTWRLSTARGRLQSLAAEDVVLWVDAEPPPADPASDSTRALTGVEWVQKFDGEEAPAYGGYTGAGIQIMIRDNGIREHADLAGRILRRNGRGAHGTKCAGLAAGSGLRSDKKDEQGIANKGEPFQWRGVAPEAEVVGYGYGFDEETYRRGIRDYGVDVVNQSQYAPPYSQYSEDCASADETVRDHRLYVVTATGNTGVDPHTNENTKKVATAVGYFSITGSVAKNTIAVGNCTIVRTPVSGGDCPAECMRCSDGQCVKCVRRETSSMGPTFDGRLKPDVMAPGTGARGAGLRKKPDDTYWNHGYTRSGGTSAAAPVVSGVIALMLEAYCDSDGVNCEFDRKTSTKPLSSTIKAILIQTADDMLAAHADPNERSPDFVGSPGPAILGAGPDWATGYGLVNARAAVATIADRSRFLEGDVDDRADVDEHVIFVPPGQEELKVTLAWDDPSAVPSAPNEDPKLRNDLELRLIEPATAREYLPWVLPPLDLARDCRSDTNRARCGFKPRDVKPAKRGEDHLNNVEQVSLANPAPGLWRIRVTASSLAENGDKQAYSLAANLPFGRGKLGYERYDKGEGVIWDQLAGYAWNRWLAALECKRAVQAATSSGDVGCELDGLALGYELFWDDRRVGYEPRWTREEGIRNCRWNIGTYGATKRVSCRFDGRALGYEAYRHGRGRVIHEPSWSRTQAIENCKSQRANSGDDLLSCRFDGVRLGYELYWDGRRVGYRPEWSRERGIRNCRWNLWRHGRKKAVSCRFDGAPLGYELYWDGRRVGYRPEWSRERGIRNCQWNLERYGERRHVACTLDGAPLGYELFWDSRRVGYEPSWTSSRGHHNCDWNVEKHSAKDVLCSFEGRFLGG